MITSFRTWIRQNFYEGHKNWDRMPLFHKKKNPSFRNESFAQKCYESKTFSWNSEETVWQLQIPIFCSRYHLYGLYTTQTPLHDHSKFCNMSFCKFLCRLIVRVLFLIPDQLAVSHLIKIVSTGCRINEFEKTKRHVRRKTKKWVPTELWKCFNSNKNNFTLWSYSTIESTALTDKSKYPQYSAH